jgi:hypothetical protein
LSIATAEVNRWTDAGALQRKIDLTRAALAAYSQGQQGAARAASEIAPGTTDENF